MFMTDTDRLVIEKSVQDQHEFFGTHVTRDIAFRIKQLKALEFGIAKYKERLEDAIWKDLHKSPEEFFVTEISIVTQEIRNHIKHLKKWAKPKRVKTPLHLQPSNSKIYYEPLGVALIMAPWNYPFQLLMNPLVGAISAGCCATVKPSPYTPEIAEVMGEMLRELYDPAYINTIQGHRTTNGYLLEQKYDMIFFTGGPFLGKLVMEAAAKNLTPVVLELGGKSPCVVDKSANIDVAAKRIAWGKLVNAGQTCIAPDYLYVHSSVRDELLEKIVKAVTSMYGESIKESKHFPRIVTDKALGEFQELISHSPIYWGGEVDTEQRYLSPTILSPVDETHPIMKNEIFGPILPVMTFDHIDEVESYVNSHDKPLAFYFFGSTKKGKELFSKTSSGGGCFNDILFHIANHHLPFGGVGVSGLGKYHGKESFDVFTNRRSVVSTPTWIDLPFRYAPYKFFKLMKKIL